MSCPYTSPQNSKVERILHTINNILRSLVFQASLSAHYLVEGLHNTTYLLNRLPTKAISTTSPYVALHGVTPSYEHLRVFGCACYPNLSAKVAHKLAPQSIRCVFLRYTADHKGYWCLDLTTNNIIVSRHVVFYEADSPFPASPRLTNDLDILLQDDSLGAAPMPAPLSAPHVPSDFLPLATIGGQIARPGGPIALGTEDGGQTAHGTEAGSPTAAPGNQTAWPFVTSSSPTLLTSAAYRAAPTTSAAPHAAPSTPPVPSAAPVSMTPPVPPTASTS
jgi:hypothetical protein